MRLFKRVVLGVAVSTIIYFAFVIGQIASNFKELANHDAQKKYSEISYGGVYGNLPIEKLEVNSDIARLAYATGLPSFVGSFFQNRATSIWKKHKHHFSETDPEYFYWQYKTSLYPLIWAANKNYPVTQELLPLMLETYVGLANTERQDESIWLDFYVVQGLWDILNYFTSHYAIYEDREAYLSFVKQGSHFLEKLEVSNVNPINSHHQNAMLMAPLRMVELLHDVTSSNVLHYQTSCNAELMTEHKILQRKFPEIIEHYKNYKLSLSQPEEATYQKIKNYYENDFHQRGIEISQICAS